MQVNKFKVVHLQTLKKQQNYSSSSKFDPHCLWNQNGTKNLLTYEETCKATKSAMFDNGFFDAFYSAYSTHGDVKVTPDDVWLVIVLYFSKYVNENAEQLRSAFVAHQGKKTLTITAENELSEHQWDEFFTLMISAIKQNTTKGIIQKLQSNFTTTGRVQRIFSTAMVMNTCQKYFDYERYIPLCGIQNIHFGGTLQDWKKVYEKTQNLMEFDVDGHLKEYTKNILYIIGKFIQTYQEKVDLNFWNKMVNIYYGQGGYGSVTKFSGWLMNFFGFYGWQSEIPINSLGFDIKIINQITKQIKMVRLEGGFKAVSREGCVFRPHLSMAILDDPKPKSMGRR